MCRSDFSGLETCQWALSHRGLFAMRLTNTGTTLAFAPMPIPRRIRHPSSSVHQLVSALPMIEARIKSADMQIAALRPKKYSFSGSANQHPTKLAERYVLAFTIANIQASGPPGWHPLRFGRPSCPGQLKFAPLLAYITVSFAEIRIQ